MSAVDHRQPDRSRRRPPGGWSRWIGLLARLLVGGVLVVAGSLKVIDPQGSVRSVRAYDLLPDAVATLVGHALPFLELALGLLLLTGALTRVAAAASAALLVVFVAAVASAWARGLSIDCGCFGVGGAVPEGDADYLTVILRDLALLIAAGWLLVRPQTALALDRPAAAGEPDGLDGPDLSDPSATVVR